MAIPCLRDEIRLNKFELHRCLSSKDIYKKMGARSQQAQSCDEVANFSRNPLEMSELDYQNYIDYVNKSREQQQKEQQQKELQSDEGSTD